MLFFFSPHGRLSRRGFWLGFVLVFTVLTAGAFLLDEHVTRDGPVQLAPPFDGYAWAIEMIGGPAQTAVLLLLPFAAFAMIVKRLHDTGRGMFMLVWKLAASFGFGWLIAAAPAIAEARHLPAWAPTAIEIGAALALAALWIRVLVIVAALAGEAGENRFGPDPLA